jgi:hypothetical protein
LFWYKNTPGSAVTGTAVGVSVGDGVFVGSVVGGEVVVDMGVDGMGVGVGLTAEQAMSINRMRWRGKIVLFKRLSSK